MWRTLGHWMSQRRRRRRCSGEVEALGLLSGLGRGTSRWDVCTQYPNSRRKTTTTTTTTTSNAGTTINSTPQLQSQGREGEEWLAQFFPEDHRDIQLLSQKSDWKNLTHVCERLRQVTLRTLGSDHSATKTLSDRLGDSYYRLGRYDKYEGMVKDALKATDRASTLDIVLLLRLLLVQHKGLEALTLLKNNEKLHRAVQNEVDANVTTLCNMYLLLAEFQVLPSHALSDPLRRQELLDKFIQLEKEQTQPNTILPSLRAKLLQNVGAMHLFSELGPQLVDRDVERMCKVNSLNVSSRVVDDAVECWHQALTHLCNDVGIIHPHHHQQHLQEQHASSVNQSLLKKEWEAILNASGRSDGALLQTQYIDLYTVWGELSLLQGDFSKGLNILGHGMKTHDFWESQALSLAGVDHANSMLTFHRYEHRLERILRLLAMGYHNAGQAVTSEGLYASALSRYTTKTAARQGKLNGVSNGSKVESLTVADEIELCKCLWGRQALLADWNGRTSEKIQVQHEFEARLKVVQARLPLLLPLGNTNVSLPDRSSMTCCLPLTSWFKL